jgi:FMN-dependent NADH-azoreductase
MKNCSKKRRHYYGENIVRQMEMGHRYLSVMMSLFGIPAFEGLFVEGHNAMPD